MRDSNPPLCWAHSDRHMKHDDGADTKGSDLYARQLSQQELDDIRALAEDRSLNSELVLNRVFLRRLLVALQESDDLDAAQLARLAPIIFRGTQAIARLLREDQVLSSNADDLPEAIGQALDALGEELGLAL